MGIISHIIASNLTPAKWRELKNMKIVKPGWLVESVKAGKLLPWRDFRLEPNSGIDDSQGVRASRPAAGRSVNPFAVPVLPKKAPEIIDPMDVDDEQPSVVVGASLSRPLPQPTATTSSTIHRASPSTLRDPPTTTKERGSSVPPKQPEPPRRQEFAHSHLGDLNHPNT